MKSLLSFSTSALLFNSRTSSLCWALSSAVRSGPRNTLINFAVSLSLLDFLSICCTIEELEKETLTGLAADVDFLPILQASTRGFCPSVSSTSPHYLISSLSSSHSPKTMMFLSNSSSKAIYVATDLMDSGEISAGFLILPDFNTLLKLCFTELTSF
ncbi:hypothetical protein ACHWQZ_G006832 [Mnemiopsis leidyi]